MSEQKLNIEFVKEVEHYPCIYDYRRSDYARKDVIDKAWAKIGTKFNLSGPQCRERWKNLRTVLSRNLRPNEGTGRTRATKQQRKPYYLFEAMKFAVPFIKSHNTVPSYFRPRELSNSPGDQDDKSEHQEENEENVKEEICHVTIENMHQDQSRSLSPQFTSPPLSPQVNLLEAPSPSPPTPPPHLRNKRSRRKRKQSEIDSAESEVDENVPKNLKLKKSKTDNKFQMDLTKISKKRFLLSLLSDVYSMDSIQMRSFRMRVLQLINDITQTPNETPTACQCACNAATSSRDSEQPNRSDTSSRDPEQPNQSQSSSQSLEKTFQNQDSVLPPLVRLEVKIEQED